MIAIPEGDGLAAIEAFRRRHDPLALELPAHVTLVFPFASSLSALQVATHVRRVCARWPSLPVRLDGVDAYHGEWVHLRVTRGSAAIVELHDRLYRRGLASFLRRDLAYEPHVTIGRAAAANAADAMQSLAREAFPHPIDAVVRALIVVELTSHDSAVVATSIGLG